MKVLSVINSADSNLKYSVYKKLQELKNNLTSLDVLDIINFVWEPVFEKLLKLMVFNIPSLMHLSLNSLSKASTSEISNFDFSKLSSNFIIEMRIFYVYL